MGRVTVKANNLTATADYTVATPSGRTKNRCLGILTRNGKKAWTGADSAVCEVTVASIAPKVGTIDLTAAVNAVAATKANGITRIRFRLNGGPDESADAKAKFGTVHVVDPQGVRPDFDSVRFWTPEYQDWAYKIETALANAFDNDPMICEVMPWANGSEFSTETMIRQASTQTNRTNYLNAGYDYHIDQQTMMAWPQFFADTWKKTQMHVWVPMFFQQIEANGTLTRNKPFTESYIRECARAVPNCGIGIDNSDLNSYKTTYPDPTYLLRDQLKAELGFVAGDQTVIATKMGTAADYVSFFSEPYLTLQANRVTSQEEARNNGVSDSVKANADAKIRAGA